MFLFTGNHVLSGCFLAKYLEEYAGILPLDRAVSSIFSHDANSYAFLKLRFFQKHVFCLYKKRSDQLNISGLH